MIKKRILSAILAVLFVALWPLTAGAAENKNAQVDAYKQQLEQKYGITITYDVDEDGSACIGTGSLATLDTALSAVTPSVVKQVSDYYQKKNGKKLNYAFIYTPFHDPDQNIEILAAFDEKISNIELYIPESSQGTFITGDSPITILHEFAHAFHLMFMAYYGRDRMEADWVALNGGVRYNKGFLAGAYNKVAFISSYGATSFEEDFAEIFSHAFVRNKEGQGFYHQLLTNGQKTVLGQKVSYIEEMLPMYLTDTSAAVANLQKIFSTPIILNYQGLRLSGEYLQFIGCAYPRYVLRGILSYYGLEAEESWWILDIGGWQVKSTEGQYYLVFPGNIVSKLRTPLDLAA